MEAMEISCIPSSALVILSSIESGEQDFLEVPHRSAGLNIKEEVVTKQGDEVTVHCETVLLMFRVTALHPARKKGTQK